MENDKDTPPEGCEHDRSFPITTPTGDDIPFHDPTAVPKDELIKKPTESDESHETE